MNRINQLLYSNTKGILSVYFTAGYPNLDDTAPIIRELEKKGVQMVEIGIPFSDPMADGPVIQNASTQALSNGMTLKLLFEQIRDIRHHELPLYTFKSQNNQTIILNLSDILINLLPLAFLLF